MPEAWGGSTIMVETSAMTGVGVSDLLEMLVLEAELLELRANPNKEARGVVLEARLTPGRGSVATVLVQEGIVHVGDALLAGESYGRVRSLRDESGSELQEAGPSTPVEVTGLTGVPAAGDQAFVVEDVQKAKEIAEDRERRRRLAVSPMRRHVTLQDLRAQVEAGKRKELAIVLKADVQGSVEVVKDQLSRLPSDEVRVDVLHGAVGDITEGDVLLADASDAVVIGFNVGVHPEVAAEARRRGVEVRTYRIIYELTDHIRRALSGMLEPERREVSLGEAEVRQVFAVSRLGNIAGCMVTRGVMRRNARVRLRREGEVLFEGVLDSLRRFTNDVSEVAEGYECGMRLSGFNDIQEGDRIEAYTVEEVARTL
jgi:translation initiation factor IF-2